MSLSSLVILMIIAVFAIQFWRLRAIAEFMVDYANQYCKRNQLQYMSLARTSTKFKAYKGKLDWQLSYQMEFSSDGQTNYVGTIVTHGKQVISIELPAYRVNSPDTEYSG